jgi:hypothetical protein
VLRLPALVAFPHTVRATPVASLLTMSAMAAVPAVITALRGGTNFSGALVAAAVIGGAGFAHAVDDDAAVVLASSPTSLFRRRAVRIVVAFVALAAGWELALAATGAANALEGIRMPDLAVEALTAAGVGVAAATAAKRNGYPGRSGVAGVATALLTMLTITAMAQQYRWLPQLSVAAHHERWLWVAATAWGMAVWASRDPARRLHAVR